MVAESLPSDRALSGGGGKPRLGDRGHPARSERIKETRLTEPGKATGAGG